VIAVPAIKHALLAAALVAVLASAGILAPAWPLGLTVFYLVYASLFAIPALLTLHDFRLVPALATLALMFPALVTFFFGWALLVPGGLVLLACLMPERPVRADRRASA
jgi:hypothetical protein